MGGRGEMIFLLVTLWKVVLQGGLTATGLRKCHASAIFCLFAHGTIAKMEVPLIVDGDIFSYEYWYLC